MPQSTGAGRRAARGARVPSTRSRSGRMPRARPSKLDDDVAHLALDVARLVLSRSRGLSQRALGSIGLARRVPCVPGVDAGAIRSGSLGDLNPYW